MTKHCPVLGITHIDDQPWLVTLPDGSNTRNGSAQSEYAKMLAYVGKNAFHCEMGSWCSNWANETKWSDDGEMFCWDETGYVTQYDGSKESWDIHRADYRGYGTGFRPVLIPIDPETMQPDPSRLSMVKDGSTVHMGTLYMDGAPQSNPTNPIGSGQPRYGMAGPPQGNTPRYVKNAQLEIGNTHPEQDKQIRFIKAGDRLVSDRVILGCVSVSDLETNLKLNEYVPAHHDNEKPVPDKPIELWARLGICVTVTPEEFAVLRGEEKAAQELLIQLIQSDRPVMYGDTYFPEPANDTYLEEDLNFDLPERPLHVDPRLRDKEFEPSTLAARLLAAHERSATSHAVTDNNTKQPEH